MNSFVCERSFIAQTLPQPLFLLFPVTPFFVVFANAQGSPQFLTLLYFCSGQFMYLMRFKLSFLV